MDGTEQKTERDRSTNTREQRAKMSGVSSGTPKGFKHCLSPYFIGFVGGG